MSGRKPKHFLVLAALLAFATGAFASTGCGSKKKEAAKDKAARIAAAANVAGLDALPAETRVVVGADVKQLRSSPLVRRAFASMLERDAPLAARLAELQARCKLDVDRDLDQVLIGLLGSTTARDVVLVAQGRFDEAAITACVGESLTAAGGALEKKEQGGFAYYLAKNPGAGDVAFGFGGPGVILLSDTEALLTAARAPGGKKLRGDARMMALIAEADPRAALWGAALVDPAIGQGLVAAAGGAVKAPAQAMWGHAVLGEGLELELALELQSADDAKGLVAVTQKQLAQYTVVAQAYALGPLVNKIRASSRENVFVIGVTLDKADLGKLEGFLDRQKPSAPTGVAVDAGSAEPNLVDAAPAADAAPQTDAAAAAQ